MTDGNVLQTWEDYRIYLNLGDVRTTKKRLARILGFKKIPVAWKGKGSAPIYRRAAFERIIDSQESASL